MENYKYVGGCETSSHFNFVYEGGEKTLKEFHEELEEFVKGNKTKEEHPKYNEFMKFFLGVGINDKGEEVPIATIYDILTFYYTFRFNLTSKYTLLSRKGRNLEIWNSFLDLHSMLFTVREKVNNN